MVVSLSLAENEAFLVDAGGEEGVFLEDGHSGEQIHAMVSMRLLQNIWSEGAPWHGWYFFNYYQAPGVYFFREAEWEFESTLMSVGEGWEMKSDQHAY